MRTEAQRKYHREYYRGWRERNREHLRERERKHYRLHQSRIRARINKRNAQRREVLNAKARKRYREQHAKIRAQKLASYQKNINRERARGLAYRQRHLEERREADRRAKWRQMRREGRTTLEQIRERSSKPEVIEARRLQRKQYSSKYSRKRCESLCDGYIINLLCHPTLGGFVREQLPEEVVDLKRNQIALVRAIKTRKEGKCTQLKSVA